MNAVVDRRNDTAWWDHPIRWSKVTSKHRPVCDDCLIHTHETRGAVRADKAIARRRAGQGDAHTTVLCRTHRDEWMTWTPGQMTLGEHA